MRIHETNISEVLANLISVGKGGVLDGENGGACMELAIFLTFVQSLMEDSGIISYLVPGVIKAGLWAAPISAIQLRRLDSTFMTALYLLIFILPCFNIDTLYNMPNSKANNVVKPKSS